MADEQCFSELCHDDCWYCTASVCLPSVLGVLLAIITVLLAIITCIEIEHVIFAGEIEFVQNAISNSAIIGFILWTARHYSKR